MKHRIIFFLALFIVCFSFFSLKAGALEVNSEAVILVDEKTGTTIYEKNADENMAPAGLTKMMTALIVIENTQLDDTVTISEHAATITNKSGGPLSFKPGEEFSVLDLLYCMILNSSNEATIALCEHVAGSVDNFVTLMNDKAASLGAKNTVFKNPHGLDEDGNVSTARDMYKIASYALQNPRYMEISNAIYKKISPTNLTSNERYFYTDNHLISKFKTDAYYYKYARGMASGYTSGANYCLISSAQKQKDGMNLLCVVMGARRVSKDDPIPSFVDVRNLFEDAFNRYKILTVSRANEVLTEAKVRLGKTKDYVTLGTSDSASALVPIDATQDTIEKKITVKDVINAPVKKGDKLGILEISYNGQKYSEINLVALYDVEQSGFLYFIDVLGNFFKNTFIKVAIVIIIILIFIYLYITISMNLRRQKQLRRSRSRRINRKF